MPFGAVQKHGAGWLDRHWLRSNADLLTPSSTYGDTLWVQLSLSTLPLPERISVVTMCVTIGMPNCGQAWRSNTAYNLGESPLQLADLV